MKSKVGANLKIKTIPAACALFLLVLLTGLSAWAQAPGACADEISQFCSGIPAGSGAIRECLLEHDNELSGWCKSSLSGAGEMASRACHDDAILLCSNVDGSILQCLKDKESWLSFECKVDLGLLPGGQAK